MAAANSIIDAYIQNAEPFAQPILKHLRQLVHQACPEIKESIKWQFVAFDYKKSILCVTASFKNHCAFGFWLAEAMDDPDNILDLKQGDGMGQFGKITSLEYLPSDEIIVKYIHQAMELIDKGVKLSKSHQSPKPVPQIPVEMKQAFRDNPMAQSVFENFTDSKKREYLEWIIEAKTEATKLKRLATAMEWISEGKSRNWKYEKK